jgi:hypothetical protein
MMAGMPVAADREARFAELKVREAETLDEMSQRMSAGEGLPAICSTWNIPYGRVLSWLMADAKRYEVYERALAVAAHALVAEAVPLSDEAARLIAEGARAPAVSAKALQIETRFRTAQHHAPEKYGRREELVMPPILVVNASLERVADALLERLSGRTLEHPKLVEEVEDGDV